MSSNVDAVRVINRALLAEAGKGLDKLASRAPVVIKAVADAAKDGNPFGNPLADRVVDAAAREALQQVKESIQQGRELLEVLTTLNEYLGSPDALRSAAQRLRDQVMTPCSDLAPDVRQGTLRAMVPSVWNDGDASALYANAFDGQQDAVKEASAAARVLADSLESLADGIEDYYHDVNRACLETVAAVIALVTGVLTVELIIGIFIAIAGAIGAYFAIEDLVVALTEDRGTPVGDAVLTLSRPTSEFADA
jgi:hypothetical protein